MNIIHVHVYNTMYTCTCILYMYIIQYVHVHGYIFHISGNYNNCNYQKCEKCIHVHVHTVLYTCIIYMYNIHVHVLLVFFSQQPFLISKRGCWVITPHLQKRVLGYHPSNFLLFLISIRGCWVITPHFQRKLFIRDGRL